MTVQIESRELRVLRPLRSFFSVETNFKLFIDLVVLKTHKTPLRLYDWFVTNYCKKEGVSYNIMRPNGKVENFCVFRSYKAQLRGRKKKEFDPFCRSDPITLEYTSPVDQSKITFETGICQLKFFKWAIENLVINYVEANFDAINEDMKKNNSKSQKGIDDDGTKRKKNELSKSIFQQIRVSNQDITLSFPKT